MDNVEVKEFSFPEDISYLLLKFVAGFLHKDYEKVKKLCSTSAMAFSETEHMELPYDEANDRLILRCDLGSYLVVLSKKMINENEGIISKYIEKVSNRDQKYKEFFNTVIDEFELLRSYYFSLLTHNSFTVLFNNLKFKHFIKHLRSSGNESKKSKLGKINYKSLKKYSPNIKNKSESDKDYLEISGELLFKKKPEKHVIAFKNVPYTLEKELFAKKLDEALS